MYRHLERPGSRPTLPAAVECYAKAVTLSGLSKAYGLPGLRVGWLASRDEAVLQRAFELKVSRKRTMLCQRRFRSDDFSVGLAGRITRPSAARRRRSASG